MGQAALQVLHALGAKCTVMDINVGILRTLSNQYQGTIDTMFCNQETIASVLPQTDMVLNCVKWPKAVSYTHLWTALGNCSSSAPLVAVGS